MKKNILHKYLSAYKYPETPYAINAIPKMIVINTGLLAANIAMNKTTIPKTKPTIDPVLLIAAPPSNPIREAIINMNATIQNCNPTKNETALVPNMNANPNIISTTPNIAATVEKAGDISFEIIPL